MTHRIELGSSFLDGGWMARCSCGWKGERQDTMREASAESRLHLDAATMDEVIAEIRSEAKPAFDEKENA